MLNRRAAAWLVATSVLWCGAAAADRDVSERRVCRIGDPRCVEVVIRTMERRFRRLERRCEHDAIFALFYLRTTETFLATLDEIGYDDPSGVVREDALFADYYFQAADAYQDCDGAVPAAWQIAFDAAAAGTVTSNGDALLGFNAHIQRDLPFVLYDLHLRGTPVSHEDHTRVNEFLAQVDATAEVVARFDPTFDDAAGDPEAFFQLIVAWREQAFVNFERLRDAPSAAARAAVAAEIEGTAAAFAAALAQATALPPGTDSSARDAYCAAQP